MTEHYERDGEDSPRGEIVPLHRVPDLEAEPAAEPALPAVPEPAELEPAEAPGARRPVIAPQWQRDEIWATVARIADLRRHQGAYHSVRLPWYAVRTVKFAVYGVAVLYGQLWRWGSAKGLKDLESLAVAAGRAAHGDAMRAHERGCKTRAARGRITAVIAAIVLTAVAEAAQKLPPAALAALGAAVVLVLAKCGQRRGEQLVPAAHVPQHHEKLTQSEVLIALSHLGIPEMNRWIKEGLDIPMWIGRDGPGWRADVQLPRGVTASVVMDKREELAAALRRNIGRVWPSRGGDDAHAGLLVLYVSDYPMSKAKQPAWPLAKSGKADLFAEIPFGTDQRGKIVRLTLMFASVLIGAIPRMGKTTALRLLALAGALDPACEMHVYDLKGTGDLAPVAKVAHKYGCGADEETLAAAMASLKEIHGRLVTRAKTISGLTAAECPERKVTPELSAKRSLRLHPVLLMIDEIQELFESAEHKKEAEALAKAILKRGPALGIIFVAATQRPDSDSFPKGLSAQMGMRFCLRIVDDKSNNMILGAGMYAAGYRATMFTASDKGVGWLAGHSDDPQIVHTFAMDAPASEKIVARALAARKAAGLLTGQAAQDDQEQEDVSLLRDVLEVMPEEALWLERLAPRLAGKRPEVYGSWRTEDGWRCDLLGSALRGLGVTPAQQWNGLEKRNRNGITRVAVLSALDGHGNV